MKTYFVSFLAVHGPKGNIGHGFLSRILVEDRAFIVRGAVQV